MYPEFNIMPRTVTRTRAPVQVPTTFSQVLDDDQEPGPSTTEPPATFPADDRKLVAGPSDWYRKYLRQRPSANLVTRLRDRETHHLGGGTRHFNRTRRFHSVVVPNLTIVNVEKPPCFVRKFSNDGKLFIAFSAQMSGIEVYEYKGMASVGNFLQRTLPLSVPSGTADDVPMKYSTPLRQKIFTELFKHKFTVVVTAGGEQLNRECSLFTEDNRHVIVCASSNIQDDQYRLTDYYRYNEGIAPSQNINYEDYWIHCIDIQKGKARGTLKFKNDKIIIAHNQGIYLLGKTVAVFSLLHQTIHLYTLTPEGSFVPLRQIGKFCYPDDEAYVNATLPPAPSADPPSAVNQLQPFAFSDVPLSGLKQRLLSFMYRRALEVCKESNDYGLLQRFYRHMDYFRWLRIWRMQLLSEEHLLLRYASEEVVAMRADPNSQSSFFVVYNIESTEIEGIFENVDEDFLSFFENFADHFRYPLSNLPSPEGGKAGVPPPEAPAPGSFPIAWHMSSVSSSSWARLAHQRCKQTVATATAGGPIEATRRVMTQLPVAAQSFSASPYLDLELFSFQEKWVSQLERPKVCGEFPVRFFARETGRLAFELLPGNKQSRDLAMHVTAGATNKNLVAYIFHPFEPFAISVHRGAGREYIVNFHLRHAGCDEKSSERRQSISYGSPAAVTAHASSRR